MNFSTFTKKPFCMSATTTQMSSINISSMISTKMTKMKKTFCQKTLWRARISTNKRRKCMVDKFTPSWWTNNGSRRLMLLKCLQTSGVSAEDCTRCQSITSMSQSLRLLCPSQSSETMTKMTKSEKSSLTALPSPTPTLVQKLPLTPSNLHLSNHPLSPTSMVNLS